MHLLHLWHLLQVRDEIARVVLPAATWDSEKLAVVGQWVSEWSSCTAGTASTTCTTCTSVTCVFRSSVSGDSPPFAAVHCAVQLW